MAMSHVQPLLLLLASFFFLPAFCDRSVDFEYCHGDSSGYDFGNITRVEISPRSLGPDNLETVNVTVVGFTLVTQKQSNWTYVEVIRVATYGLEPISHYPACELIACPVKRGIDFRLYLPGVTIMPAESGKRYAARATGYVGDRSTERMVFCVSFEMPEKPTSVST